MSLPLEYSTPYPISLPPNFRQEWKWLTNTLACNNPELITAVKSLIVQAHLYKINRQSTHIVYKHDIYGQACGARSSPIMFAVFTCNAAIYKLYHVSLLCKGWLKSKLQLWFRKNLPICFQLLSTAMVTICFGISTKISYLKDHISAPKLPPPFPSLLTLIANSWLMATFLIIF